MSVDFNKIINKCSMLGYVIPGKNNIPNNNFASSTKLDNCYFGEYDSISSKFISVNCSPINRSIQTNPTIIILAESPHKDEYNYISGLITPKFPLFKSQSRIQKYLKNHLPSGLMGKYDVYLVNAIQYQCSFGLNLNKHRKQKNKVFALTWNTEPALKDLIAEINKLVKLENSMILNCCVVELKKYLCMSDILRLNYPNTPVYECPHPSKWK